MAHTTEELLLAAAVSERATAIRAEICQDMSDAEYEAFKKQPIEPLVRRALEELNQIAGVIKRVQSGDQ